jgi:tRNA nucleotidyltransferase (CCA-adding enzyme)
MSERLLAPQDQTDKNEHANPIEVLESFPAMAQHECDPSVAADLRFVSEVTTSLTEHQALALVVGGFVRDAVMARVKGTEQTSKDIDVEVYGADFDALATILRSHGRVDLVGASFGIAKITNPHSGNVLDFSIPRRDSKVDKGHRGFQVTGDPNMSVDEAARRRDLTINTLAMDPLTGELIDHYGGVQDIKDGVLRATDPSLFTDDPLRVLRIMQFAGRFEFSVDPDTLRLCKSIDLTEVSTERIGEEWVKLMTKSPRPSVGLEAARQLGVLDQLHPDLAILDQIPQEADWHPEGNVWNHTKHAADAAAQVVRQEGLSGDEALVVLFGALCHDLGKATTTALREKRGQMRITAYGHEAAGVEPTKRFLQQLHMNKKIINTILPIVREHLYHVHNPSPNAKQLRRFAGRLQPANIRLWDLVSRCDANGRGGEFIDRTSSYPIYQQALELEVANAPLQPAVNGRDLINLGMPPGPHFGPILAQLYTAQVDGHFTTTQEGVDYLQKQGIGRRVSNVS